MEYRIKPPSRKREENGTMIGELLGNQWGNCGETVRDKILRPGVLNKSSEHSINNHAADR